MTYADRTKNKPITVRLTVEATEAIEAIMIAGQANLDASHSRWYQPRYSRTDAIQDAILAYRKTLPA